MDTVTSPRTWVPKSPEGGEGTEGRENILKVSMHSSSLSWVDTRLRSEWTTSCFTYPYCLSSKRRGSQAWQLLQGRRGTASPADSALRKDPGWG